MDPESEFTASDAEDGWATSALPRAYGLDHVTEVVPKKAGLGKPKSGNAAD